MKTIIGHTLPSKQQIEKYERVAIETLRYFGAQNKQDVTGICDMVCVKLWDLLGKPKDLFPTRCFVWDSNEQEHVVLMNYPLGWILDPTGAQFDNNFYQDIPSPDYSKFKKLKQFEIEDFRNLGQQYLKDLRKRNTNETIPPKSICCVFLLRGTTN